MVTKTAEVTTNDPARERFNLAVRLMILDDQSPSENQIGPFYIIPSIHWKGKTPQGMSVVGFMTISNRSNEIIRIKEVRNPEPMMSVKLNVMAVGKRYGMHIRSALNLPVGVHRQSVVLVTDSPTTPELKIDLELEVTP
jgi:hypothetical protein